MKTFKEVMTEQPASASYLKNQIKKFCTLRDAMDAAEHAGKEVGYFSHGVENLFVDTASEFVSDLANEIMGLLDSVEMSASEKAKIVKQLDKYEEFSGY